MTQSVWRSLATVVLLLALSSGCAPHAERAVTAALSTHETTLALAPPKDGRSRPLVVVLADNAGTETTDFVMPYSVLKESGAADVVTVSTAPGVVTLIPALRVRADMTLAQFDAAKPHGADIVIVPAMKRNHTPALLNWLRRQAEQDATVVSICEGAKQFVVIASNWLALWRHESIAVPIEQGVDEMAVAQTADAWSRTYRSRAFATGSEAMVRSRRGLLIETEAVVQRGDVVMRVVTAPSLDATLDDIAARYGQASADLLALELEHRRHGRGP
jgi:putative intracellular protease/amidase